MTLAPYLQQVHTEASADSSWPRAAWEIVVSPPSTCPAEGSGLQTDINNQRVTWSKW